MEDSFRHGCMAKTLAAFPTLEWHSRISTSYSVGLPVIFGINKPLDLNFIDLTLDIQGLPSFEVSII